MAALTADAALTAAAAAAGLDAAQLARLVSLQGGQGLGNVAASGLSGGLAGGLAGTLAAAAAASPQASALTLAASLLAGLLPGVQQHQQQQQAAAQAIGHAGAVHARGKGTWTRVSPAVEDAPSGTVDPCKIFVGGLPHTADENSLSSYFSNFGYVTGAEVKRDQYSGQPRGFGFVTFGSPEAVQEVLNCGYAHTIGPKQVEVKQAKMEEPRGPRGGGSPGLLAVSAGGEAPRNLGAILQAARSPPPAAALPPLAAPASYVHGGKGKGKGSFNNFKGSFGGFKGNKKPYHEHDEAKVFVVGIPKTTSQEEVRAYFSQFGAVKSVELLTDRKTGQYRSYCFVTFEDPLVAKAIQSVPGLELGGQGLELSPAWPSGSEVQEASGGAAVALPAQNKPPLDPSMEANKIFVGGLLKQTSEEEIKEFFSQFGPVVEVILKKDSITGGSRGFGFVTFGNAEALQKALANYNANAIGGKWVDVRKAEADGPVSPWQSQQHQPLQQQPVGPQGALPDEAEGRKLFLGGLAFSVTEDEISQYFSQWGIIADCIVKRDHEGHSRGFGFVTFVEPESMTKALENYDKITLGGKWVETRPAGGYKGHMKGSSGWRSAPY